jgi:hypothetical protein
VYFDPLAKKAQNRSNDPFGPLLATFPPTFRVFRDFCLFFEIFGEFFFLIKALDERVGGSLLFGPKGASPPPS